MALVDFSAYDSYPKSPTFGRRAAAGQFRPCATSKRIYIFFIHVSVGADDFHADDCV